VSARVVALRPLSARRSRAGCPEVRCPGLTGDLPLMLNDGEQRSRSMSALRLKIIIAMLSPEGGARPARGSLAR
jgi:hypothetical protein